MTADDLAEKGVEKVEMYKCLNCSGLHYSENDAIKCANTNGVVEDLKKQLNLGIFLVYNKDSIWAVHRIEVIKPAVKCLSSYVELEAVDKKAVTKWTLEELLDKKILSLKEAMDQGWRIGSGKLWEEHASAEMKREYLEVLLVLSKVNVN